MHKKNKIFCHTAQDAYKVRQSFIKYSVVKVILNDLENKKKQSKAWVESNFASCYIEVGHNELPLLAKNIF